MKTTIQHFTLIGNENNKTSIIANGYVIEYQPTFQAAIERANEILHKQAIARRAYEIFAQRAI